ncbi:hypothetical protein PVBG_06375 [Plasmodium vivax Brazil I]|uniref:Vir protein n=1 Tax=Plasmodium vivax (strain Brazil I) TaxID=1033975 RepID=A0A0J9VAS4_PLAV1|nr:hypothetical protein PVBG_06375 [Plasmodium vivax Brazil I]
MDNDWRERKELYEYYVDYDPIIKTVKNYSYTCKEFYQYVEKKKYIYNHFKKLCPPNNTNRCPEFYAQCEQYDPEKVLPHFSCHREMLDEKAAAAAKASQKGDTYPRSEADSEENDGPKKPFDAPILSGKSQTVENLGNVLLGVVATTMTSGALYRVNTNSLIQIN